MATERNPENTRLKILNTAFHEIHRNGYQGMRIDEVLNKTGLKKGALYHHFSSKQALGLSVLEELIEKHIESIWLHPLQNQDDPIRAIDGVMTGLTELWSEEFFYLGCPLNNLAQEMSPLDGVFREKMLKIFEKWCKALVTALNKGQENGFVDKDINVEECALFIIASLEGILGMTKNQQDIKVYQICIGQMRRYLNTLRVNDSL